MKFLLLLLAMTPLFAQTDIVYPWVTNNSFQSQIIVNNPNPEAVTFTLTASRPSGLTPAAQTVANIEIAATGQWIANAGDVFDVMGVGAGYSVRLTSDADNLQGAFVVRAGTSPAQANVVPAASGSNTILFNYMPADSSVPAAPVIVNTGSDEANVTFYAFQKGQEIFLGPSIKVRRTVPAGLPHAELVTNLFTEVSGDLMIAVESDQPLLGVAFLFNQAGEPSMANAVAIDKIPGETHSLGNVHAVRSHGQDHYFYELMVHNRSNQRISMSGLTVNADGVEVGNLTSFELANDSFFGTRDIEAENFNLIFVHQTLAAGTAKPEKLTSRLAFRDAPTRTLDVLVSSEDAVSFGPPMRGDNWVAFNSLHNDSGHRRASIPIDGLLHGAQRFAIDWIKAGANGLSHSGDATSNDAYYAYGQDLLAVADGEVIRIKDGIPDNVPPGFPAGATVDNLVGNFLVLDLGDNRFVTYAHIVPGSFKVSVGDRVAKGDVLAQLGNSGNSSEPHLHMHVTDSDPGPTGLQAHGVPHVFESYLDGQRGPISDEMPQHLDFVNFPDQ